MYIPRNIAKPMIHINEDKTVTSPRHRYRSEIHANMVAPECSKRTATKGRDTRHDLYGKLKIYQTFDNPPTKATAKGGTVMS